MDNKERQKLVHELLNMGEVLLSSGAEVNRVEDTLNRMGKAYGALQMNTFVITSSMVLTMTFPDGESYTESRRILRPGGPDFQKVEKCNALSRECCMNPKPVEELRDKINEIGSRELSVWRLYIGSIIGAASFAIFFGGGVWDGLTAALFGFLICICQRKLDPFCANRVMFNLICSFLMAAGVCLLSKAIPVLLPDKIIIGDIMLLIPGLAMTSAVRDIIVGDTIAGLMRLIESLLWAFALACGVMVAIWMVM